ncbi:MAG: CrcB family protein [Polyangiaceae bacterium]|nr:CrcB family protein [Polyangiaceae bacterium]
MTRLLWIAAAGAAGTLARVGLSGAVTRLAGPGFPWGILLTNALGCLLFGLAAGLSESRIALSPEVRGIVQAGFLGAFTTFSTFAFDSWSLLGERPMAALANVVGSVAVGLAAAALGLHLGRLA